VVLSLSISCKESCLFISWCADDMSDMTGSDEHHDRSRRPDADDRRWSSTGRVVGGRMIKRLGDAVCGVHRAQGDEGRKFLSLALKARSTVCQ
jgi:hypothetical protein